MLRLRVLVRLNVYDSDLGHEARSCDRLFRKLHSGQPVRASRER